MNIFQFLTPKSNVAYVDINCTLRQALEKMRFHGYTALPVIDSEGRYVGTVNEGDFLWDIVNRNESDLKSQEKRTVSEILRTDWNPPIDITASPEELLQKVQAQNFLPVIDARGVFVGIITRGHIIKYFTGTYLTV